MRKIFLFIFLLSFPLALSAQWYGDGLSASTAYYGVINSTFPMQIWNTTNYPAGLIYVGLSVAGQNDLEIGSGGTLTISQGITIKFCTISSDLRITGTGILNATGLLSNPVIFTKNTQATWGHISFELSTGSSIINYCTIEYGSKTGTGIEGYGGGIHANTNTLTISNSTIRYNYAQYGGGIFVNQSKNPAISNCYVYNNRSIHAGGGFYFWNSSSSVITNCIFDSNHCLEASVSYYTGGGLAAQTSCAIKVVNCTFVNNTSTRTEGQALLLHSSGNSRVINSIFWGTSDKQIYCYGTSAGIIINSAYRGITYSSGTPVNPIVLNSSNTATDGPNFAFTDGSDWSIKFISPCRDKGVNSYTGVTIPSIDYIGKPTIGTKDIGAYEVQYSRWTGATSTDWSTTGNWDKSVGPLTGTGDVIIPFILGTTPNYPVGTPAPNFTIGANKQMIIKPGAKATLGTLTNYGTLKLESDAIGISSLIVNSFSENNADVELYLTGGAAPVDGYKWHYISSPFTSLSTDYFTGTTSDLAQWVESMASADLMIGWVAYDGFVYRVDANPPYSGPLFSNLITGKGYTHYFGSNHTYTLQGQLNTVDIKCTLDYTVTDPDQPTRYGLNLLGNPFSSGLDWDAITFGLYSDDYPLNTSKVLHYAKDGGHVYYINGVGSEIGVNGIIPPMQGFFNKTYSSDNKLTLPAGARVHDGIPDRYKGSSLIPLVRINLTSGEFNDNTVVRFDYNAKSGLDFDFDAVKEFISETKPYIYSLSEGTKYVINGQPFPETSVEIPIVVNITSAGNHTISTTQLQGLDNYNVYVIDNTTGFTANLKTTPVLTFSSSAGLLTDRFILKVSTLTTGTEEPLVSKNIFTIYQGYNLINIQTIADEWEGKVGSVRILDLAGKIITDLQNTEFRKNSITQVQAPAAKGLYVVEIMSGVKRYVGKVVIR